MTSPAWQPYREPLRTTLIRTITIAVVVGAVVSRFWGGSLARWPIATLLILWPSFGGHWVEMAFLEWIRPKLPRARVIQVAGRLAWWFCGGVTVGLAMALTGRAFPGGERIPWPAWWIYGLAFIAVELIAHTGLQLSGRASFFNGRG